eukprot:321508_1
MNTNINQRPIKRASRANDITNCDWRDDARNVTEHVEQATGKTADLFWRGICHYCPTQRPDALTEEGQRHKADDHPLNVDVVAEHHHHRQQHAHYDRCFTRNVQRSRAAHQPVGNNPTQHTADKTANSRNGSHKARFQNRHPTRLHQINRKPGNEKVSQGVDTVLTDINADHHP